MKYQNIVQATFIHRPNRFIAYCQIDDKTVIAHVKNTGRCQEILIPGTIVYLEYAPSPTRKTAYSLIAARKGEYLINIDSQIPNYVALEGIKRGTLQLPNVTEEIVTLKKEVSYRSSRFDLYLETLSGQKIFVEVKGVTLERDGMVSFPDAPTKRGTKHIYELIEATKEGYCACILFVVQMSGVHYFTPNKEMDLDFATALLKAKEVGIHIMAYECAVTPNHIEIKAPIAVCL